MSKQFWLILPVALAVVAGVVWMVYSENQESLVNLDGEILKVRTYQLNPTSTIVIADFRVTNPDAISFVVDSLTMQLEKPDGERVDAWMLSKADIDSMFAYQKLSGPQYNQPLIIQDRVEAGESWDRMAAGRVDLPENEIAQRLNLFIQIEEIDGRVSEISEEPLQEGTPAAADQ